MGTLPVLKPREAIRILDRLGFVQIRQKGSHRQFRHPDGRQTTVPDHGSRDLSPILLRQIIKDIGLTAVDFLRAREEI
jgi:predicted RNA binding protein YcfA (HicA-like mRNA interferase family)